MLTLKAFLTELALAGPSFVVNDSGYPWPADELIEWLEWQNPAQLEVPVLFVGSAPTKEGVLYALDSESQLVSTIPLYVIERRQLLRQFRQPTTLLAPLHDWEGEPPKLSETTSRLKREAE